MEKPEQPTAMTLRPRLSQTDPPGHGGGGWGARPGGGGRVSGGVPFPGLCRGLAFTFLVSGEGGFPSKPFLYSFWKLQGAIWTIVPPVS